MINIYTPTVNRPEFISYQKKCFDKFLLCKYNFTVIDDSSSEQLKKEIQKECIVNNVNYIRSPNNLNRSAPSHAHGSLTQWWFDNCVKDTTQKVLYLDSDAFLFDYFDAEDYINNYEMCGAEQARGDVKYLWPGLLFINLQKIKDKNIKFSPCYADGEALDTGGSLHFWLKNNPDAKIDFFKNTSHITRKDMLEIPEQFRDLYKDFYKIEILMSKFIHYGQGSNWDSSAFRTSEDPKREKTQFLYYFLNTLLENR